MARRKQIKKEGFDALPNCVNNLPEVKGKWAEHFGNDHPIVLELGCGKGDMAVGMARIFPEKNFIGVDVKAVRMFVGATEALEEGLENVAFLRADLHGTEHFFEEDEVSEIWITFPDPFPKKKHTKNRLTYERFLLKYATILKPTGRVHFKTDNVTLFDYTIQHLEELEAREVFKVETHAITRDLHASEFQDERTRITTDYERRFQDMGKPINYLEFTLLPGPNVGAIPCTEPVGLDKDERAPRPR